MKTTSSPRGPVLGLLASLLACYGLLGLVALAGSAGIALAPPLPLWTAMVFGGAAICLAALWRGRRRHGQWVPLALATAAAALLAHEMWVDLSRLREALAFAGLGLAAWMDRRACARCRSA